ncbi:hypothetical protein L3Y34_009662 [Caenorhabditis briggsae]|uniref:Nuclear Hormone Receptor family n=1 Tax=Caenorhabditis briggsae TaxID=6238 RepID=A0AAE9D272_CAEBR|nr:hypothetical protein L3Y34_009662 [Caenorhabditis briggsae]
MLKNSESLCHVCGSESNGMYHYGAQVCRACAAFFRRALTSPYPKKCRMNQKCDFLTKNGYFKCKFCRLKKCYDVGMSSENFQLNRDVHNTACRIPESPESPIFVRNSLEKLAFSLGPILKTNQNINSSNYGKIYGMDQSMAQIEHEILTVTKWLTHFDGFLDLAPKLQIQIFQACWNLWWKLERLATTAMEIRRNENLRKMKRNSLLYKFDKTRIDVSWLTRYSLEELKFFLDLPTEFYLDDLTIEMLDLKPISEKFQQILADDLHDYYTNEMSNPYYMKRLAKMMKINNMIQLEAYKNRSRTELAFVFDIFNVEISHSEIFRDY